MTDLSAEAKYLMSNPAFVSALQSAKTQALNAALSCDGKDDQGRRVYLDAVRTVDKVASHIAALMAADKPEEIEVTDFYTEQAKSRYAKFRELISS